MFIRRVALGLVFAGALSLITVCPAQAQKAKANKPPVKSGAVKKNGPIVLGTKQLPGDFGKMGTTYTIGNKDDELNFTLLSAEYSTDRAPSDTNGGDFYITPTAEQKYLILRFTAQNPTPHDTRLFYPSFQFTAVSNKDTNHSDVHRLMRVGSIDPVDFALKPAQKVELTRAIIVPAEGELPKLIVQRGDGAVIRYDLRGKVKPLPALYADPADKTGATPIAVVSAARDTYYPFSSFDIKFTGVSYVTENPVPDSEPAGENERLLVATFTLRGTGDKQRVFWQSLQAAVLAEDGEKVDSDGNLVRGSRKAIFDGTIDKGQEVPVRILFRTPKEVKVKTLRINEPERRAFAFDISNAQ